VKYLLVFLVILLVAWKWRSARTADQIATRRQRASAEATPTQMVQCAHCDVHIPAGEALTGLRGVYCCNAHRKLAES
jgi:uncharacterized protein